MILPLALAACGFTPANAPGGPVSKLHERIRVDDPSDKNGFDFVERMEERLGRPEAPAFDLAYTITTKAVGDGSGLGLSVVHGIMQAHQGAIDVKSVLGEGSVFSIHLPMARA